MIDMKLEEEKHGERSSFTYVAREQDKVIGYCAFYVTKDEIHITKIDSKDALIADGLVRASLFWAADRHIFNAIIENESFVDELRGTSIGKLAQGEIFDIGRFFANGCCHN